jgi:glycosyltransferase involved in cell wall biosynthesis
MRVSDVTEPRVAQRSFTDDQDETMSSSAMRVVHVLPTDIDGGAARGAHNLHVALRSQGVDSLMLVQRKYSDDPYVFSTSRAGGVWHSGLRDRLDRLPLRLHKWRREGWWTVGWLPFDVSELIDQMKPDVVQFHWAGRGAAPIKILNRLADLKYPMVWTLRDMWPLTGGCHYSNGCEKFLDKCGACPQLNSSTSHDLSRWLWQRKYRAWQNVNLTYIAMCNWMADYARRSPLTFGNEVSVIPNGIDVDKYTPADKAFARSVWRIEPGKKVILFGALHATLDPRKGFSYLSEALRRLAPKWKDRAVAVVFGGNMDGSDLGIPTRSVGRLHDDVSLALLYSTADVMVVPSVQENFGKTAIEAMACGAPVVAFANTGQIDILDHKINGYLAEDLSSEDLASGIEWCLEHPDHGDLARRARAKVVNSFDLKDVAARHIDLYSRLIARRYEADEHVLGPRAKSEILDTIPSKSLTPTVKAS